MEVTVFLGVDEETAVAEIWNGGTHWGDVRRRAEGGLVLTVYPKSAETPPTCDLAELKEALAEAEQKLAGGER